MHPLQIRLPVDRAIAVLHWAERYEFAFRHQSRRAGEGQLFPSGKNSQA